MKTHWLSMAAAAMFIAAPDRAAGQARQTTRTGVYSAPQASRGADVYAGYCKSCHTPLSHTGAVFHAWWNGKALSDLYAYIRDRMPKNDPGSLSEQEYADVTAYLLKMNQMPAGKAELPTDSAQLSRIRIVVTKSQ